MNKQSNVGIVLAALAALGFSAGAALAQGKDGPRCVAADGKEVMTADGKPITSKAECDKAGGTLQAPRK
ncbi:MAG: acetate--CoA ligase [Betaproteobacteria bacterium]|nr:acetate--CoA ligase [Betaproteobacteria bacterium]